MPVLGQGTWEMGVRRTERAREVVALQLGFDLGMTLVDTAEMYASGGAEEVVGEAIRGRRDAVFVVSKVLPENASTSGTLRAAERSLRRLGTDHIDLYLLHWRGRHPVENTLEAFSKLVEAGKILHYGVSNFDLSDMVEAEGSRVGPGIAANQIFYNPMRRGPERKLIPWCIERGVVVMAYSPLEQARLQHKEALRSVARRHGISPAQVALAWAIREPGAVTVVKASNPRHVQENAAAASIRLTPEDFRDLDGAYPVPQDDVPLETL
jgi:diketogulonate reductase-like aldo/keto reductase